MAKYHFNIPSMWKRIFGKSEIPTYVNKAFEKAKEYVDECNPEYEGMLILFDHKKHFDRMFDNRDLTRIEGRNMKRKREEIDDYVSKNSRRVLDSQTKQFYKMIGHHGESPDGMEGAVAITLDGRYVESGLFVEGVTSKGIQVLADTGARHRAGAFASKNLSDYSLVVSEETGRVTLFKDGKTHMGKSFTPKTKQKEEPPQEQQLFSEDI